MTQSDPQTHLHIRLATAQDIPQIAALIPLSVRGLGIQQYSPRQIESALQYVFGVDTQLINDETYFVAVTLDVATSDIAGSDLIVGAGGWSRRRTLYGGDQAKREPDQFLDPAIDAARIRAFYVRPDWSRRGIGRRLMQACEAAAHQAGFTQLELMATLTGEALYSSNGFVAMDHVDINMPDGVKLPVVKMVKPLSEVGGKIRHKN